MTLHVDYYASLNSPWTHLGAPVLEAVAARHGAAVRMFPVDFATIFPATGGLPLPRRSPQRQAYRMMELRRWRERREAPLVLSPRFFPAREALGAHAVIAARERASGITAHTIDGEYDRGHILAQTRVPVFAHDDAQTLAKRVLEREHEFYPWVLSALVRGRCAVDPL